MTFTLRDLIATLTAPACLWLRKQRLLHRKAKYEADVAVIEKQEINDRAVKRIRHCQIAEINSELNHLNRL